MQRSTVQRSTVYPATPQLQQLSNSVADAVSVRQECLLRAIPSFFRAKNGPCFFSDCPAAKPSALVPELPKTLLRGLILHPYITSPSPPSRLVSPLKSTGGDCLTTGRLPRNSTAHSGFNSCQEPNCWNLLLPSCRSIRDSSLSHLSGLPGLFSTKQSQSIGDPTRPVLMYMLLAIFF